MTPLSFQFSNIYQGIVQFISMRHLEVGKYLDSCFMLAVLVFASKRIELHEVYFHTILVQLLVAQIFSGKL